MHSLLIILLGAGMQLTTAKLIVLAADVLALTTIPSVLLRRRGRPLAALSWSLAVLTLPLVGVLAWWMLGRTHLQRPSRRRRAASQAYCARRLAHPEEPGAWCRPCEIPSVLREVLPFATVDRRRTDGVFPPTVANHSRLLVDGCEAFTAMESAMGAAAQEIHAMFYIWKADDTGRQWRDLLIEKARQGVRVRVLVDAVGSPRLHRMLVRPLRRAGACVSTFLPARFWPWSPTFNFRNHRKLLVVDRRVAFLGGMNVGDEYAGAWHDCMVQLEGPVVRQLNEIFEEDWFFASGEDLADSPLPRDIVSRELSCRPGDAQERSDVCVVIAGGPDRDENRIQDALFLAITGARGRVWLTTPYFIPALPLLAALRGAAQRGVDVRLLVPKVNDVGLVGLASHSYYPELLEAGVQIFEYTGGVLHMKALVVDHWLSVTGSANVDVRSLTLNFELACFNASAHLNARLAQVFESSLGRSDQADGAALGRRSVLRKLAESIAHLLSPLL